MKKLKSCLLEKGSTSRTSLPVRRLLYLLCHVPIAAYPGRNTEYSYKALSDTGWTASFLESCLCSGWMVSF